jgi:aminoglycoside phosphotransferase (APT) family kinase protein
VPWQEHLAGWSPARSLREEIQLWEPLFGRALDPLWADRGTELKGRLLDSAPPEPAPGLLHGDFYSNNVMFDGGKLQAVVDWEISGIGPPLLDLGWLCMWYDRDSWGPTRRAAMGWAPEPAALVALYEQASGRPADNLDWYQAVAGYRFAAITALNLRLHRTGRRPDPAWEVFGESFPHLIDRAHQLLDH